MKNLIISFFILILFSSCASGGKYPLIKEDNIIHDLSKRGIKTDFVVRIHTSHGKIPDMIENFSNLITPIYLSSANVLATKDAFDKLSKVGKNITIAAYGHGQQSTKIMLIKILSGKDKKYQNIHLIYIGLKEYSQEIKTAAEARGMKYSFFDIYEISKK